MFLQNFVKWNEGNEIPPDYLLWAGYSALSILIGRRVFLDVQGHYSVRANIYTLLIGPTGNKKTSAVDKATELILSAAPDTNFGASQESYQGIISYMTSPKQVRKFTDHTGVEIETRPYGLFVSELMNYLAINPIQMIAFLTDIYDNKPFQYRLRASAEYIHNPYFVMCACTTDDWLTAQCNTKIFSQGYGRRSIFVYNPPFIPKRIYFKPEHAVAKGKCIEWLTALKDVVGPMQMTDEAWEFYWEWYLSQEKSDDRMIEDWRSSKHVNVHKLCILNSLNERTDKVITLDHVKLSVALLDQIQLNLPIITAKIGRSEVIEATSEILLYLRAHKGYAPEKELQFRMNRHFKSTLEYFQVLGMLIQTEKLVKHPFTLNGVERVYVALPECVKLLQKEGK